MYDLGGEVAFGLWAFYAAVLIVKVNSTMNANLKLIGCRLSWLTLGPKSMVAGSTGDSGKSLLYKIPLFLLLGLCSIPLSWAYVVFSVFGIGYSIAKDVGAPVRIKEARWKLRNIALSRMEVWRLMHQINEGKPEEFDRFAIEMQRDLEERGFA